MAPQSRSAFTAWGLSLAMASAGCTGTIDAGGDDTTAPSEPGTGKNDQNDPGKPGRGTDTGTDTDTNMATGHVGAAFPCGDVGQLSPTPLMRLTKTQYFNSLSRLFGSDIAGQAKGIVDAIPSDDHVFKSPDEFVLLHTEDQVESFYKVAVKIADVVKGNATFLTRIGGACLAQPLTTACMTAFINNFGHKVLRRPLTAVELTEISGAVSVATTSPERVSAALEWMLQSAAFLYRVEIGESGSGTSSAPLRLTPHEIATRLSFLIQDTTPDDTLLGLAASGQLRDMSVVQAQVDRLFDDPLARAKVAGFASYWLLQDELPDVPTNPAAFLAGLRTTGLKAEMMREAREFVQHIVFDKKGSYRDLMTDASAFSRSPGLAQIYGHAAVTTKMPAQMGGSRRGLLMRSPLLLSSTYVSSIIMRGVRMRTRVLCQNIPEPANDLIAAGLEITPDDLTTLSNRDRVTKNTSTPSCAGCHSSINPTGFVFERFDSVGRIRGLETLFRPDGSIMAQHPLNTATNVTLDSGSHAVADESAFADLMANSVEGRACLARQIYRYYELRNESSDDSCRLGDVLNTLKGQGTILDGLKKLIVNRYLGLKRVN